MFRIPPLSALQQCLADPNQPIGARMRASYHCKQIYNLPHTTRETKSTIVKTLAAELKAAEHGKLMRHEFAYVLGQMQDPEALASLCEVLEDQAEDCICRHECAEAIGAVGTTDPTIIECLRRNEDDTNNPIEIRETCRIALDFLAWKNAGGVDEHTAPMACACMLSSYDSKDPAPAHPSHEQLSYDEIGAILRDARTPLFERYRAMFSLRNKGGPEAAAHLGAALVEDESSALFRHEVAFVLGQLQHVDGLDYLARSLEREHEHEFVRHESAEAVGAIEGCWERSEAVLNRFLDDDDPIVRQSCQVALDGADYFGLNTADGGSGSDSDADADADASIFSFAAVKGTTLSHFNVKETEPAATC